MARLFGAQASLNGTVSQPNCSNFNLLMGPNTPKNIANAISYAREHDQKLKLIMTGGPHANYVDANGVFALQRWKDKQDTFNTTAIKTAVRQGVADGTVVACEMIDEPGNTSAAKGWGGKEGIPGITKATLDVMASYVHGIFPTLPAGIWNPRNMALKNDPAVYQVVDFAIDPYLWRRGAIAPWITEATEFCDAQGLAVVLGINPLNGGFKPSVFPSMTVASNVARGESTITLQQGLQYPVFDDDMLYWSCSASKASRLTRTHLKGETVLHVDPLPNALVAGDTASLAGGCAMPLTGGLGTTEQTASTNCAMTADQYQEWSKLLLSAATGGLVVWRWDATYMAKSTVLAAETGIRSTANVLASGRWSLRI